MITFFAGLGLGALIVFLLSWGAHYSLLEDNRDLKREVMEFRSQELERLLAAWRSGVPNGLLTQG